MPNDFNILIKSSDMIKERTSGKHVKRYYPVQIIQNNTHRENKVKTQNRIQKLWDENYLSAIRILKGKEGVNEAKEVNFQQ
jgi:hypothetical protein